MNRVRKLEQRSRWLAVGLVLAVAPWLIAAADKITKVGKLEAEGIKAKYIMVEDLEARTISLTDKNGKARGSMLANEKGAAFLLTDANGKTRFRVDVTDDENGSYPEMVMFDPDGKKERFRIGFGESEGKAVSAITFTDPSGMKKNIGQ